MNGAMIFIFGMLNLGFLVQFISVPVSDECLFTKEKTKNDVFGMMFLDVKLA